MNYPEVPPGCPYFRKIESQEGWWFITGDHHLSPIPLAWTTNEIWRPIIAAVAIVYWQKESRRIIEAGAIPIDDLGDPGDGFLSQHVLEAEDHADEMAEQWEEWGWPVAEGAVSTPGSTQAPGEVESPATDGQDDSEQCEMPGCPEQATHGTPNKTGYCRVCGKHFREINPEPTWIERRWPDGGKDAST